MAANPIVTITMENGDVIRAELYPEIAPNSVNNFISLIKKGLLRWAYLSPRDQRLYDPGRLSERHRYGRPGLQH